MKKQLLTLATFFAIQCANAQAPVIPAGQSFVDGLGIGVPVGPNCPSGASLHIRAANNTGYVSGNGQQLFYGETVQAPGDRITISNGKGGAGATFIPIIAGHVASDPLAPSLSLVGSTTSVQDVSTGSALLRFITYRNFTPNTACGAGAVSSAITNRPLFQWANYGTNLMTMTPQTAANGDARLGLGTTTPAWKLDIASPFTNDGIRVTQTTTSAATLKLKGGGTGSKEWSLWSGGSGSSLGTGNFGIWDPTAGTGRYRMSINGTTGNLRIGGTAIPANATHRLHVIPESPNFDPVRFEGLNFANDSSIVTVDNAGVLHKTPISSFSSGSGISNSCTTIGQVPVVNSATGNLGCSQITDNGTQVGISTTAPTSKLHIMSPLGFTGPSLTCERNDGTNQTNALDVIITSNGLPSVALGAGTINFTSRNLTPGTTPDMAFSANNLDQQLIIKNNGDVGIGTNPTTGLYKLDVNGMIRSTSLLVTSDAKFKKDITPLKNANDIISKLQGVTYNWKTEEFKEKKFSTQKQIGFIAQEVEKVLPEAVTKDANGDYAVNYIEIIPVLTEALKQQNSKIENLENQLAEIKAMLSQSKGNNVETLNDASTNFKLFPNPVSTNNLNLLVYTKNEELVKVTIIDMQGKEVARTEINACANCTNKVNIDIAHLSNGNYNVSVLANGKQTSAKFVVAK